MLFRFVGILACIFLCSCASSPQIVWVHEPSYSTDDEYEQRLADDFAFCANQANGSDYGYKSDLNGEMSTRATSIQQRDLCMLNKGWKKVRKDNQ
jgi:hypothetical protein